MIRFPRSLVVLASSAKDEIWGQPLSIDSRATFVVGCGHSGTTLMASLIGRHPNVLGIGGETGAFSRSRLYAIAAVRQWDVLTRQFGKVGFVEKTPKHIQNIRRIFGVLPEARIIWMVREPLDNIASLYERTGDLEVSIKRYVRYNRAGLRYIADDRVMMCKYECLVTAPSTTIATILSHLRLAPHADIMLMRPDSMYEHWLTKTGNKALRAGQVSEPIYDRRGRWRTALDDRQVTTTLAATREIGRRLGYGDYWTGQSPTPTGQGE